MLWRSFIIIFTLRPTDLNTTLTLVLIDNFCFTMDLLLKHLFIQNNRNSKCLYLLFNQYGLIMKFKAINNKFFKNMIYTGCSKKCPLGIIRTYWMIFSKTVFELKKQLYIQVI